MTLLLAPWLARVVWLVRLKGTRLLVLLRLPLLFWAPPAAVALLQISHVKMAHLVSWVLLLSRTCSFSSGPKLLLGEEVETFLMFQDTVGTLNQDGGETDGPRASLLQTYSRSFSHPPPSRQNRGESGSPDLSRPKFTSQEGTQKTTKACSSLLPAAIVPRAAVLLPHPRGGAGGGSPDAATLVCLNIFKPAPKACLATEHEITICWSWRARLAVLHLLSFFEGFVAAER